MAELPAAVRRPTAEGALEPAEVRAAEMAAASVAAAAAVSVAVCRSRSVPAAQIRWLLPVGDDLENFSKVRRQLDQRQN